MPDQAEKIGISWRDWRLALAVIVPFIILLFVISPLAAEPEGCPTPLGDALMRLTEVPGMSILSDEASSPDEMASSFLLWQDFTVNMFNRLVVVKFEEPDSIDVIYTFIFAQDDCIVATYLKDAKAS